MSRRSDALQELALLAQAVGTTLYDPTVERCVSGLAIHDWRDSGTFELVEFTKTGVMQYPLGRGVRTNVGQLQIVNRFIRAFSLTTNLFGETERIVVDSEGERKRVISLLNEAGAGLTELRASLPGSDWYVAQGALQRVIEAKSILLKRVEVQG